MHAKASIGNVILFPAENHVEKLLLRLGRYRSAGGKTTIRGLALTEVDSEQAMNPFRTGQLVLFQVRYDRSWHFFEIIFFIFIGIFGGLYGAFVMKWNLRAQAFRKKYLTKYAILEATLLAAATAIVCYPNMFLRIDMTESMEILFLECEGAEDYNGICE